MASINDVVLIYFEEQALSFARVEEILPDAKPGWYHVKLLLLQLPLRSVTWILREAYIDGEGFTMGGNRIRLEKVVCPEDVPSAEDLEAPEVTAPSHGRSADTPTGGKIISLADKKKRP